ncbi:hypothetical protein KM043_014565 [Ampulex compressa]|nr:hypothetical protein KM043_014565 [Ampulex compressa]
MRGGRQASRSRNFRSGRSSFRGGSRDAMNTLRITQSALPSSGTDRDGYVTTFQGEISSDERVEQNWNKCRKRVVVKSGYVKTVLAVAATVVVHAKPAPEPPSGGYFPPSSGGGGGPSGGGGSYGPPSPPQQSDRYGPPQQQPVVHKHVYVHVPPPETPEYKPPKSFPAPSPPQKHYKIVFIKAPTSPPPTAPALPALPQPDEEKTLIYVLVKKPEEAPDVVLPTQAPTQPSKPEVYFIRYKTQKEAQNGGDTGAYGAPQQQPAPVDSYGTPQSSGGPY